MLRLAQERGIEAQSTSLEAFRQKLILREPLHDLGAVLGTFQLFQRVLDRPEVLEQVAFEVVEDVRLEGTRRVELRFSPGFVCERSGLSWEDALTGFEAGLRRAAQAFPEVRTGLICIASRDYGIESAAHTAEFFLKHRDRFVGLDLAGNEQDFPCRLFENAFRPVRDQGLNITIHAGESAGPDQIWEAIEHLGARRIGHGIACVRDPQLMERLRRDSICLEMCPTSNWLTRCVPSFEAHPLPRVLRAGIPVCINTDDPGVFAVTLPEEVRICREKMGMTDAEISQCFKHAEKASFLQ